MYSPAVAFAVCLESRWPVWHGSRRAEGDQGGDQALGDLTAEELEVRQEHLRATGSVN